ncbi:MAG: multicopper oxidase domain-containing protein [Planctomycetota bacterium]|jgi:FtsP/CotA-like multicopper oxidase with cupredoxin domain
MNKKVFKLLILGTVLAACVGLPRAHAIIHGITGTTFNLSAKSGQISTPDGGSIYMWGYAEDPNQMQYPGPTLIVDEDVPITINLTNTLTIPVSIVFPGQTGVTATGGSPGLLTSEADPNGGTVSYSFTPTEPGTYIYNSGTNPDLQVEMGLVGALIVRPTAAPGQAYAHPSSAYDRETLFLFTEIDPNIHQLVAQGNADQVDSTTFFPVNWFINGRCAPDTMTAPFNPLLPHQPYNCMPMMHPGERLLLRVVSAGRDPHPFHTHGSNFDIIARDGRLWQSAAGVGADLLVSDFTISVAAGGTEDAIFTWTGEKLGWDMYGHDPNDPLEPGEYAPDHGKPFPVLLPPQQDLTFGAMWSGSPFLGNLGTLPPGEGGNNPNAGFTYMWHSHAEKEMCNNDIFPGGLMTMLVIQAPSVAIVE